MRINPQLIPRLDVEFSLDDLRLSLKDNDLTRGIDGELSSDIFPQGHQLFTDSGRTALFLALKAIGLKKGASVGVPLFTCDAVFEAVSRAGCRPIFIDIDPKTYTIDIQDLKAKIKNLEAIVPVHTFGHPADMDGIREVGGHLSIIEDCVHGVGTLYKDEPVGSSGDACFYSFRPGKPMSVGKLGMLICKEKELYFRASKIACSFPRYEGYKRVLNSLRDMGRGMFYRQPWFGLFSLPVGLLMDEKLDFMDKSGFDPHQPSTGSFSILYKRMQYYPAKLKRVLDNVKLIKEAIDNSIIEPPFEATWGTHSYFQFAIKFRNEHAREQAATHLTKQGIDSIKFYHNSPENAIKYGYNHDCPVTESITKTLLTIPCYAGLTSSQIKRIIHTLRHFGGHN